MHGNDRYIIMTLNPCNKGAVLMLSFLFLFFILGQKNMSQDMLWKDFTPFLCRGGEEEEDKGCWVEM